MKITDLRHWQTRCIKQILKHYETKKHFFCQATPAAGKTRMAAALAYKLLCSGKIDLIVCFAPTCQVVIGIQKTFESVIGRPMNGLVGAIGAAFTYPAMDYREDSFWELFESHRVFVVFDEIHHCAGSEIDASNSWGATIVQRIQDKARFTLALSGTPWRSDARPIVLAKYSQPDGRLICDFRYSLKEAVEQGVCRTPQIVLLDNKSIELCERQKMSENRQFFPGFEKLLNESEVTYEGLLRHDELAIRLIKLGAAKLDNIREKNENAGGLIVATDVGHANVIALLLQNLGESYCVVTNQTPDAQNRIEQFRHNSCRWIVAVGMVSEGTDIQRLQVCCYLSRIRTELHFRQVLGRILRRKEKDDALAWFYALAEPKLKEFAKRIADDLPIDHCVITYIKMDELSEHETGAILAVKNENNVDCNGLRNDLQTGISLSVSGRESSPVSSYHLSLSQNYWHEIISIY